MGVIRGSDLMPDVPEFIQAIIAQAVSDAVAKAVAEVQRQAPPKPADPRTMPQLWRDFLPTVTNENTRANYESARKKGDVPFPHGGKWLRLNELTHAELSKKLLRDWLDHLKTVKNRHGKPFQKTSLDHTRKSWQAMLSYYVRRDELPSDPFRGMRMLAKRGEGRRVGALTEAQEAELLSRARPMCAAILRVAGSSGGLRNTEARTLRKVQADLAAKTAWVVRKGGKVTTFTLADEAVEIIRAWSQVSRSEYVFANPRDPEGGPVSRQTLEAWVRDARGGMKLQGGEDPVPHHWRHTFANRMLAKGAPTRHVAEQMGHADDSQMQIYGKMRGDAEEAFRELQNMTVAEAKRARRAEYLCPTCSKPYPDIRQAAACYDKHQRAAK